MKRMFGRIIAVAAIVGLGSLGTPRELPAVEGKLKYHDWIIIEFCSNSCSGDFCCITPVT